MKVSSSPSSLTSPPAPARLMARSVAAATLIGLMLTACGGVTPPPLGSAPTPAPGTGPVPVLSPDPAYTAQVSAQDASLAGTDRDQDGTRDDLDHHLAAQQQAGVSALVLAQSERYVRATGQLVTGATQTAAAERLAASLQLQLAGELARTAELDALMLNTDARLQAFAAAQAQAGGALVRAPQPAGQARLAQTAPVIVFQNGIFSDEAAAVACLEDLRRLLGAEGQGFEYYVNYNGTDGLKDLMEVFDFKVSEGGTYVDDFLRNVQRLVSDPAAFVSDLLKNVEVLRAGVGTLKDLAGDADVSRPYFDSRVDQLATGLTPLLESGRPVVLVPHSQGNLYAQAVVDELRARQVDISGLSVVGVATPGRAGVDIERAVYFNSVSDQVMNGLRALFPVAPANDGSVPVYQGEDPVLGHAFGSVYTNPKYTLAPRIKAAVLAFAQPAAQP